MSFRKFWSGVHAYFEWRGKPCCRNSRLNRSYIRSNPQGEFRYISWPQIASVRLPSVNSKKNTHTQIYGNTRIMAPFVGRLISITTGTKIYTGYGDTIDENRGGPRRKEIERIRRRLFRSPSPTLTAILASNDSNLRIFWVNRPLFDRGIFLLKKYSLYSSFPPCVKTIRKR